MSPTERHAYDEHLSAMMIQNDVLDGAKLEGRIEGRIEGKMEGIMEGRLEGHAEGRIEGRAEGHAKGHAEGLMEAKKETAQKLKLMGLDTDIIHEITGLSSEEILRL